MINHAARQELSELLRHFIAGRLDNFAFEERLENFDGNDDAVDVIVLESWFLYDDFQQHYMTGKWRLSKTDHRIIARWILFLHSDLPNPTLRHDFKRLVTVLTGGVFPQFREPKYRDLGAYNRWPFFRESDFKHALSNPKLLAGRR